MGERGEVLGTTGAFEVETPWWQDVEPIVRRHPELCILRLLRAEPPGTAVGGAVTYLAQPRGGASLPELEPCEEALVEHPLRMPWAHPGGPQADLDWAAGIVAPTGEPRQHRTWNLSAIWSIPTAGGWVWLKCVPGFFAHEASVLDQLRSQAVPELLARDGHRMLLSALPGEDGYAATPEEQTRLVDDLVQLQLATAAGTGNLLLAGVPDLRWPGLTQRLADIVERRAADEADLRRLIDTMPERIEAIAACGLPDVLVHGDAHPGNARIGTDPMIWFDWGDSFVGSPLLDLAVLARLPPEPAAALERHWLDAWRRAVPGSEPDTAWRLARPLAALRFAAVYQGFLDQIEPSERPYHESDVEPALRLAARLAVATEAAVRRRGSLSR